MKETMHFKPTTIFIILLLCTVLLFPANAFAAVQESEESAESTESTERVQNTPVQLTAEEIAFRNRTDEIVIGCPINNCPMLFTNEETGELEGITIGILDMISKATGLTFRYQPLPSGSITYEDLQQLEVDMVAGVECNTLNEKSIGIVMTDAYIHAAKVFVCKKGTEFHTDSDLTIAVHSGSQTLERVIQQQYPHFQVLFCDSAEEALSALHEGKADAVLQNQYTVERILRKPIYEDLQIVATAAIGDSQCLGRLVPVDKNKQNQISDDSRLLISILNKGIASLDQSEVSFLIIRETAENAYQFTFSDIMYRYRYAMVGLLISLFLIIFLLRKNYTLHQKRKEQIAAQQRAKELSAINAQMKEQQLLLMDALKHAEEGNRAKTSFLFNMSHDIRTPMNAILGFTEIASRNMNDTAKLSDCLEKIQISGRHLLELINNVLDMTRFENEKVTLTEELCNIRECVEKTPDILQEGINRKHLTLQVDTHTVTNQWICCDSLRLSQIVFNLLSNAVKFSKPGGNIYVFLRQEPSAMQEYASYELLIKDEGIGMSPEFLAHIFEPFERERTSTISQTQGAGLGMAITKNLVDLMGGTIQVVSEQDKGTEVILHFTFKLQEHETREQVSSQVPAQPKTAAPGDSALTASFIGRRLLLVDDNELNMEIAQELLEESGFLVETASDGQIAVDMVQNSRTGYYDAILMDIQMPVMDGYQASQKIRSLKDKDLARIPIIALTANAFDEDKKKALESGMNAHIAKPLDMTVLHETLRKIFSKL